MSIEGEWGARTISERGDLPLNKWDHNDARKVS